MHRILQTTFGGPGEPDRRKRGNCYSACLASVLETPLADVPRFVEMDDDLDRYLWVQNWLADRGMFAVELALCDDYINDVMPTLGVGILSGKSPRGDWRHSVVSLGSTIIHDPRGPEAEPLEPNVDRDPLRYWSLEFLVSFDPTRVRHHTRPDGLLRG